MICVVDRNQILFDIISSDHIGSFKQHGEWNSTAVLTFLFYISHLHKDVDDIGLLNILKHLCHFQFQFLFFVYVIIKS